MSGINGIPDAKYGINGTGSLMHSRYRIKGIPNAQHGMNGTGSLMHSIELTGSLRQSMGLMEFCDWRFPEDAHKDHLSAKGRIHDRFF